MLAKFGSNEQKRKWMDALLDGSIRSAFAMTEPSVASSDATSIECLFRRTQHGYVINGKKWWISGCGHPNLGVYFVVGKCEGLV